MNRCCQVRRSPLVALVLTCGLLSLAGVPPFGGFFGKFMIFNAIIAKGTPMAYFMAFVGAAGVVISLYYYLRVVARLYLEEPKEGAEGPLPVARPMKWLLYTCLAGVFLTGIVQPPFVELAQRAARALF